MSGGPPRALPGLSFGERRLLFADLVAASRGAAGSLDVVLGERPAIVVLVPNDVRVVLQSSARKGRPDATLRGIEGHVAAPRDELRRKRGAVMAALRMAAPGAGAFSGTSATGGDRDGFALDTATHLMAHLSGAAPGPPLAELCTRARKSLRAAIDASPGEEGRAELGCIYTELADLLSASAPFVRDLTDRGWSRPAIAAEIVMLTFAGWASLAAVCQSARTLGVGGPDVTASDVTELLRIAPPGWLITRETVNPLVLSCRSAPINPGTLLVMSPWLLHRDLSSWERPDEFDASRRGTRDNPAYLPFGVGNRRCPAEQFSRSFLASLLMQQRPSSASHSHVPSLTDERSTCLIPQEEHPA